MNVSPCTETTGCKISCVEDFLVSLLYRLPMWTMFREATSKQCLETPTAVTGVWTFPDEESARRLANHMCEAVCGGHGTAWFEPVVDGSGFCAYVTVHTEVLAPVS